MRVSRLRQTLEPKERAETTHALAHWRETIHVHGRRLQQAFLHQQQLQAPRVHSRRQQSPHNSSSSTSIPVHSPSTNATADGVMSSPPLFATAEFPLPPPPLPHSNIISITGVINDVAFASRKRSADDLYDLSGDENLLASFSSSSSNRAKFPKRSLVAIAPSPVLFGAATPDMGQLAPPRSTPSPMTMFARSMHSASPQLLYATASSTVATANFVPPRSPSPSNPLLNDDPAGSAAAAAKMSINFLLN
jgi:hypothetical protein